MSIRVILFLCIWAKILLGQSVPIVSLDGLVTSESGTPLSGVQVTATTANGAVSAVTNTDSAGLWRMMIAHGSYLIDFSLSRFDHRTVEGVKVPGERVLVSLSKEAEKGQVGTEADDLKVRYHPVVDPERTHQADFIADRQLQNLPVNVRSYLSLATLTPGVAPINNYVGITDAPLVQAPQSGLSFGGNNGRGNVFWLDGGENYVNTGGVRPSISQEAVAEFQVARSNYSAEFGGGIGGIVNTISKSGTNEVHGDLFGYLLDSGLNARNYFEVQKSSYTRSQVGFTLGAPLRKDRAFIFAAFERLQGERSGSVPIGRNDISTLGGLTFGQQQLATFLLSTRNPQLAQFGTLTEQLLNTSNYPSTLALFSANKGLFPFNEHNSQGSLRLDYRLSDNNNFFLRFNSTNGNAQNAEVDGLNAFSRSLVSDQTDQTLMLNDNQVISAHLVSETRLSFNRNRFNVRNQDTIGPSIDIDGFGLFGKNWELPSDAGEWHGQFQQNIFYTSGKHSLRFGVDINPVRTAAIEQLNFGGRFTFGQYLPLGQFYNTLTGSANTANNLASFLLQSGQHVLASTLNSNLTAIQAFDLGAPAIYLQGFGNPRWSGWFARYNTFINDVYHVHPRLTLNLGLRYELETNPGVLGFDPNTVGPRLGLAWVATGDRKTVVRAGYGIFYLMHQTQLAAATDIESGKLYNQIAVPLSGLPGSTYLLTGLPVTSANIFQALSQEEIIGRRAITSGDLSQFGISVGPNSPYQVLFQKPTNFRHGYSEQTNFEIERAVGDVSLSLGYNFVRGAHLPRLINLNEAYGPLGPSGIPTQISVNPLVSQLLVYQSAANSFYHALFVQAERRFSNRLTLNAHYTFSKSIDESTDINFLPNDSLNPRADRGLSTFDQRHRVVVSAVWQVSGAGAANRGLTHNLFNGFTLSPIVSANSGQPFNVVSGLDFNSLRPAGAGRNIGMGPSFFQADLRLSRTFALAAEGRIRLEFIAETFNLTNHVNFERLNNTVGDITAAQLPHLLVGVKGDPNQALSFLSAYDPRQIQVALKLRW